MLTVAPGTWYSTSLRPTLLPAPTLQPFSLHLPQAQTSARLLCLHLCPWHGRCGDRGLEGAGLVPALP